MNLVDSPKLDYQETGGPSEKQAPWWRRHFFQLTLIGLNVILGGIIIALLLAQPELLRPSGSLVGRIVNMQGSPLPEAQIFVSSAERWATVNDQGQFVIDHVPAGETLVLIVSSSPNQPPKGPPLSATITIPAGGTFDVGTVALEDAP